MPQAFYNCHVRVSRVKPVFFYGLFMDVDLLNDMGCAPATPTLAYVDGFGLRIGARATLVPSASERVYGVIISLAEDELNKLYSGASLADYQPETVLANEIGGTSRQVVSYLLPKEKLAGKNTEYALALAKVAGKVGLPSSYLLEIDSWSR